MTGLFGSSNMENGTSLGSSWNELFNPLWNGTWKPTWNGTWKPNWNSSIFPKIPGTTIDEEEYKLLLRLHSFHDRLYIVHATFAALALSLNTLLITIFVCMAKQLKARIPNVMFLCQSSSDLLLAICLVLSTLSTRLGKFEGDELYKTYTFFFEYTIFLSVNILLLATLERLTAIRFPLHRHAIITIQKVLILIIFTFVISSIPAIVNIANFTLNMNREYQVYNIVIASICLTEVTMIYTFLLITYTTIKRSINSRIQQRQATQKNVDPAINLERKKNIRILRIFLAMCSIYAVTFLPHIIMTLYHAFDSKTDYTEYVLLRTFELVYASSAIINPIITILFKDDYRQTLRKFVKKNISANRAPQMEKSISYVTTISRETSVM